MNEILPVWTDVATIAVFDAAECERRGVTCELYPLHTNEVVREGIAAVLGVSIDGIFNVRVTNEDLYPEEEAAVHDKVESLGLEVTSGRVYLSGMDLPGDPEEELVAHGAGRFIQCPNGLFVLRIASLRWSNPAPLAPDIVICLFPRIAPFTPVAERPILHDVTEADVQQIIEEAERKREGSA